MDPCEEGMTMKINCTQHEWDDIMEVSRKKYISTKTRIDVEDAIQGVRNSIDDMNTFIEMYIDSPIVMTTDETWNYLDGIKNVLTLRVEHLWNAHVQREHIDGYGTIEEVMDGHRAKMEAEVPPFPVPKKKGKKK
jgi:hypothetical protein